MMNTLLNKLRAFFFAPASARPIAGLRIALSLLLLGQAFTLAPQILELYGNNGILQGDLSVYMSSLSLPSINWLQKALMSFGISPDTTVRTVFFIYIASLVSLLWGWQTRVSTIIAWFTHFVLIVSSFVFAYGVDHFANIFLFYLIWMPAGDAFSVDSRTKRRPESSMGARLALRVLQFELCVVYFSSGIFKMSGTQWRNGEAIWRSVMLPMFSVFDLHGLAQFPLIALLISWMTVIIEIGYPFFIFPRRTRRYWIVATVAMHFGIALFLGLVSFGIAMALLTLTIFGISAEPQAELQE